MKTKTKTNIEDKIIKISNTFINIALCVIALIMCIDPEKSEMTIILVLTAPSAILITLSFILFKIASVIEKEKAEAMRRYSNRRRQRPLKYQEWLEL